MGEVEKGADDVSDKFDIFQWIFFGWCSKNLIELHDIQYQINATAEKIMEII